MIELVAYDPRWPIDFEAERERLAEALGPLARRIDHHGSTAVPRLAAKPIIDIQISVDRLQPMEPFADPLRAIGYRHVPSADDDVCPFFHRPHEWPHRHHVHVVAFGGEEERRTLAFRDYLRAHAEAAEEYAALKQELAGRYGGGDSAAREAYAVAKTEFVERITRLALA